MHLFFAGVIVGIIILQTAVLAPTLFKTLDAESAGKLIRALFPKFFLILAALGVGILAALLLQETAASPVALGIAATSIVFPLVCRMLIPTTNAARDAGNHAKFKMLHKASVIMTVIVLLSNIALPFVG